MNLTAVFLPPTLNLELDSVLKTIVDIEDSLSDVGIGIVPLTDIVVTSLFDATIPYTHNYYKMHVPCPKAIPGTEKVLTIFSLSV
jgi:hypothetical protein